MLNVPSRVERLSDQAVVETMQRSQGRNLTLTQADIIEDSAGPRHYPNDTVRHDVLAAQVEAHLRPLRRLRLGWDSYGALPLEGSVIDAAHDLLVQFVAQRLPFPYLIPTVRGGLSLEWSSPGFEFSLTLSEAGNRAISITAYLFDQSSGQEWEANVRDPRVLAALQGLRGASS